MAQVISATFTARQERRRLLFERTRIKEQGDNARLARFEDAKREHFVNFLYTADLIVNCAKAELLLHGCRRFWAVVSLRKTTKGLFTDFLKSGHQLKLLVPDIERDIRSMEVAFTEVASRPSFDEWYASVTHLGINLRGKMQGNLGIRSLLESRSGDGSNVAP